MINVAIGYDRNNRLPAYTAVESILQTSSTPINLMFLHSGTLKEFTRKKSIYDSTEFSISRFLVPYLYNFNGWTVYLDNDMIIQSDITELFNMRDDRYAVMCVKHNYIPKNNIKFKNHEQYNYTYKNWSSVMLFNNKKCKNLTLDYVNTAPGLDLHQFKWLEDKNLIGELPLEWNYLVGNNQQTIEEPKLIHYTEGGPYYKETQNCEYADRWFKIYNQINDLEK